MKELIINVEQKHIDQGKVYDCSKCPVALAINDHLAFDYHSQVGKEHPRVVSIEFSDRNIVQYMAFCDVVYGFIVRFDASCDVNPFTFCLSMIPERLLKP